LQRATIPFGSRNFADLSESPSRQTRDLPSIYSVRLVNVGFQVLFTTPPSVVARPSRPRRSGKPLRFGDPVRDPSSASQVTDEYRDQPALHVVRSDCASGDRNRLT